VKNNLTLDENSQENRLHIIKVFDETGMFEYNFDLSSDKNATFLDISVISISNYFKYLTFRFDNLSQFLFKIK